jgi:hypothetical protein
VYRRLAGPRLRGRTLLLGLTPELRDLLAEGSPPVLVDMSRAMYAATTRLLRRADPRRETWLESDWCDVALEAEAFDLILGDMVWWGLSIERQRALAAKVASLLAADGRFVGRLKLTDAARVDADPEAVVAASLARLDAGEPEQLVRDELLAWLYDHTQRRERRTYDRERTRSLLVDLAERPDFAQHRPFLLDAAALVIGGDWTCQTREEQLGVVGSSLRLVEECRADDYDSVLSPVVALARARVP